LFHILAPLNLMHRCSKLVENCGIKYWFNFEEFLVICEWIEARVKKLLNLLDTFFR